MFLLRLLRFARNDGKDKVVIARRRSRRSNLSLLCLFFLLPTTLHAWEIARFETRVQIHPDSTATVVETITADFSGEEKHGIYRDIPLNYVDRFGQRFRMRLTVLDVTSESGGKWRYKLESLAGYRRIRIGDPDKTITGIQTYRITYEVQRGAVRFFSDHQECYWNLTGNEWAVPIRSSYGEIALPPGVQNVQATGYVGSYGSKELLSRIAVRENVASFDPVRSFQPYEGMTAAVSWTGPVVQKPPFWKSLIWFLEDNAIYAIPVLFLFGMLSLWKSKGREFNLQRSVAVQYEPPKDLRPAEVGTMTDQCADLRDITSTVIDLAVRGYLRIKPLPKSFLGKQDYELESLKAWQTESEIRPYENKTLNALFSQVGATIKLSDLNEVFYKDLASIRDAVYKGLVNAGYFDANPAETRNYYLVGGLGTAIGLVLLLQFLNIQQYWTTLSIFIVSILSGIIVALIGQWMPRRTLKGATLLHEISGFAEFLKRADQDRLRRMNDPTLFERGLPYALALNLVNQWSKAFEGIYMQPPAWYVGNWNDFSAPRFGRDLNSISSSMGQTFTSQPRSSGSSGFGGGGFSGGGSGGGGGGSW
jgi:uncharacterized membrane protein